MWFNNALIYHCEFDDTLDLNELLSEDKLKPCPPHARFIYGWLPVTDDQFTHTIAGASLISLGKEERILPRGVVQQLLNEKIEALEAQRGYAVKRAEKAHYEQLKEDALYFPDYFYCEYVDALKKGYSGVALYARQKPLSIVKELGLAIVDTEGRYIQFDYPTFSIASIYFPSGTSGDERQAIKYVFLEQMAHHFQQLKASGRELILCGDYNIAHQTIDLKNWKGNQKNSGFLPEERAWLDQLFGSQGFMDAFRLRNQEPDQYTWWSNRGQARAKNVGWRIDYQVITSALAPFVKDVSIYRDMFFSDHAPLVVEYQGDWCV